MLLVCNCVQNLNMEEIKPTQLIRLKFLKACVYFPFMKCYQSYKIQQSSVWRYKSQKFRDSFQMWQPYLMYMDCSSVLLPPDDVTSTVSATNIPDNFKQIQTDKYWNENLKFKLLTP